MLKFPSIYASDQSHIPFHRVSKKRYALFLSERINSTMVFLSNKILSRSCTRRVLMSMTSAFLFQRPFSAPRSMMTVFRFPLNAMGRKVLQRDTCSLAMASA
jgi:hypothetical protein